MVQGADNRWRTMSTTASTASKRQSTRSTGQKLAEGLGRLGYELERTPVGGRFEIVGVSREVIEAFPEPCPRDRCQGGARGHSLAGAAASPRHASTPDRRLLRHRDQQVRAVPNRHQHAVRVDRQQP